MPTKLTRQINSEMVPSNIVIFTLTLHKNHKIREKVVLSGRQRLQGIAQILPVCT